MKILIEGKHFNKVAFLTWLKQESSVTESPWISELKNFTKEWFNDKDFINVHTSGSSGNPKWIKHSKASVVKSAQLTLDYFGLKEGHKMLLCLPTRFIAGKLMFVRAEQANLEIEIIAPTSNPFKDIKSKIDFIAVTPHQLIEGLNHDPQNVDHVKTILIGGGPISADLLKRIGSLRSSCFHSYGMTETITHIAIKRLNGINSSSEYKALPGVRFSTDDQGALVIHAEHLDESPLLTNDMVSLNTKTSFEYLGRMDHMINSGGIKLNPEQIEQKISSIITRPFLIASEKNNTFGEQLILLVEGNEGELLDIRERIAVKLKGVEMPKAIYAVNEFSRTENGKLKRKEIILSFLKTKEQ